jgi:hypothetical protein
MRRTPVGRHGRLVSSSSPIPTGRPPGRPPDADHRPDGCRVRPAPSTRPRRGAVPLHEVCIFGRHRIVQFRRVHKSRQRSKNAPRHRAWVVWGRPGQKRTWSLPGPTAGARPISIKLPVTSRAAPFWSPGLRSTVPLQVNRRRVRDWEAADMEMPCVPQRALIQSSAHIHSMSQSARPIDHLHRYGSKGRRT